MLIVASIGAERSLLAQAGELRIAVIDPAGSRVPGAAVLLATPSGTEVARSTTNTDGDAVFEDVSMGRYDVEVHGRDYQSARRTVSVSSATSQITISLALATVETSVEVAAEIEPAVTAQFVGEQQLAETISPDLAERLTAVPGVNALRRGGTNFEPVIQGLRETQIAMVVDHTRTFAAGPARMDSELSHVDPNYVESVEVIRGPYALTEAAGALSAILVETRQAPRHDRWRYGGAITAGYRSNGSGRFGRVRLDGGGDRFGFSLRTSGNQGNDYEAGHQGSSGISVPGDYSNHQFGGKLRFNPGARQEISLGSFYDEQTGIDYPGRILNAAHFILRSWSGSYVVAEPSDTVKAVRFNLYLNKKSHRMSNDEKPTAFDMPGRTPPFGLRIDLPTESDTFGGAGSVDLEADSTLRFKTGFDFYNLNQDAQRFVSRRSNGFLIFSDVVWPDARINDQGVYAQATKSFESGQISAAARLDFVQADAGQPSEFFLANTTGSIDQNEANASFSLTGHYRLAGGVSLGGGFGRVVRPANALERYSDRFPSTKFQVAAEFLGDPAIDPETSYQGDVNVEIRKGNLSLNLGGFYRRIDDIISVAADPGVPKRLPLSPPTVFRYVNGGHAAFRGFQFGARYGFGVAEIRVQGSKTIADEISKDVAAIGINEPLLGIPPLELSSAIRFFDRSGRFWAEYLMRNVWDQTRVAASRFESPSPGFTSHDIRFGANLSDTFSLHIGVENLGDKYYFEHLNSLNPFTRNRIPEPGRSFFAGLTMDW